MFTGLQLQDKLANFYVKSSLKFDSVSGLDVKKEIVSLFSKKLPEKVLLKNSIVNGYFSELAFFFTNF